MIVCTCFGITDGEIRAAMRGDNQVVFPAGTCCGSCLPLVSDIVRNLNRDDTVARESDPSRAGTDHTDRD